MSECTLTAHPIYASKEIHYGVPEGPESGIYVRGTAQLVNGQATIEFPEHFSLLASEQDMTAHLTPLSASSQGLAVISKSPKKMIVQELSSGTVSYEFEYVVNAVKKGFENFQVVRNKGASAKEADDNAPVATQAGRPE